MTDATSSRLDVDPRVRRAAALGRNRAMVERYSESELRAELSRLFPVQHAVRAGIEAFRHGRRSVQR